MMSDSPASDPNKKQPDDEKRRIEIPAWWSIVALIMACLLILPIHYATMHTKKNVATEAEAKPTAAETPSPAKEEAKPADTQVTRSGEPVEAQPKPSVAETASPAKEEAKPVEAPVTRTAEPAEAKPTAAEAAPPANEEAKPAEAEVTRAPEQAEAQPKPSAPEAASPAKQESAPVEAQAKPLVADAGAQAKQDIAQPKPDMKQPVALPKIPAEKQKIENAVVFRIDGKDKDGRPAAFDFVVLSSDYVWALGSTSQVVSGGKVIREAEAANRIFAPKVRDALAGASDVIGVGLASKDGIRSEEEARAVARSKTVATWITKVAKPETALWALTLGQYDKGCKLQEDKEFKLRAPCSLRWRSLQGGWREFARSSGERAERPRQPAEP